MRALPNNLPAGLYEAAARQGIPARSPQGSRSEFPAVSAIPRSFTGQSATARTSSPLARQQYAASPGPIQAQVTGVSSDWVIPLNEKAAYDQQFLRLDVSKSGFITGEQAVGFFSESKLPEDDLAQIWDLSDITKSGQLSQDEFAVAMHLIRQQLKGKSPLPVTLPPNLIPPSLRKSTATAQTKGPVPNSATLDPPRSKSALDDLFGLEVTPMSKQKPQSTGGSVGSFPTTAAKGVSPPPQATSHFKPFEPSSSFGQSIAAPQSTGQPSIQRQAFADDDLLGDTDPETSKKFTQDTTDVANLTNQVTTLTTQTNDLQAKKVAAGQELNQSSAQKRDIETRLTQLRATYEQEARALKALQDRLSASKIETTKLQQDFVMAQHSFQVLQEQKQQIQSGLEADQRENASLKEQMAEVQRETNQIKPQIEKAKTDAQQQKALVSVNKQQLSTIQAERTKAQAELQSATSEYHNATREVEESHRSLEAARSQETHPVISPPIAMAGGAALSAAAAAVASPALSTSSMNPFFRRVQSSSSQGGIVPSASPATNHSAFDSFFDNTFSPPAEGQHPVANEPAVTSASENATPVTHTQETSQTESDSPSISQQPPPPPRSRQMTPSILPLREGTPRAPSADSSLGVRAPDSLYDDGSEHNTPSGEHAAFADDSEQAPSLSQQSHPAPSDSPASTTSNQVPAILSPEPKSAFIPVPGAFPMDSPTEIRSPPPEDVTARDSSSAQGPADTNSTSRSAFDALFGSFSSGGTGGKGKAPVSYSAFGNSSQVQNNEFPPIQEFGHDDDDDSSDEDMEQNHSAANNIAPSSGPSNEPSVIPGGVGKAHPSLDRAPSSEPPAADAQKSPPTYQETISPQASGPRDANQFAAEYTGLLPSRDDPFSLHRTDSSSKGVTEPPIQTTSVTAVDNPPPITHAQATNTTLPTTSNSAIKHDDFDTAFGDLSETKAADAAGEDDFQSSYQEGFDEFNPTFDSPAPSKATTLDNNVFHDFESPFTAPAQSTTSTGAGTTSRTGPSKNDWDALFANFGTESVTPQANGISSHAEATQNKQEGFLDAFNVPNSAATAGISTTPAASAVTPDTEHDDPIVKHLTGMGYPRDVSVVALEKFDYNLDKVCPSLPLSLPPQGGQLTNQKAANYLASHS